MAESSAEAKSASFLKWLEAVDDDAPLPDVLDAVARLLGDAGIKSSKNWSVLQRRKWLASGQGNYM